MTIIHYLFSALGGALGAVSRAGISKIIDRKFPWSTFVVNFFGSLLIGIIIPIFSRPNFAHLGLNEEWMAMGFCGGFSTFSSLSYQTLALLKSGKNMLGFLNITLSVITCVVAVWLGMLIGNNI